MTSTTDTAQHPDVSEISDLAEGLLSPARSTDLRQHLDGCELCADVHDSLEEIRGLLGTLPGPPRMPADVAGRIDAALAAEALLDATAPGDASTPEESTAAADVSRETSFAPEPSSPAATPAVAAGTVRTDRPAGRPKAATGPGRGGSSRWRRHRTTVLGAAFGAAFVGIGALLLPSLQASDSDVTSKQASAPANSAAGDHELFSETRLQDRVDTLLSAGAGASEESGTTPGQPRSMEGGDRSTSNSPLLTPAPDVPACIQRGIGSSLSALAAERGTYQGSDAYLVVLPDSGDSTRVQAYVVDAACVTKAPTTDGTVLLTHSYLRR
ncbi:hypothetical protein [Streptomyces sp. NPDC056987]|uniref:hypothetical protein n=1 Tax=Streptomyces sp. NPDC056987 TaxID=3345988 RepID=UPI003628BFAF